IDLSVVGEVTQRQAVWRATGGGIGEVRQTGEQEVFLVGGAELGDAHAVLAQVEVGQRLPGAAGGGVLGQDEVGLAVAVDVGDADLRDDEAPSGEGGVDGQSRGGGRGEAAVQADPGGHRRLLEHVEVRGGVVAGVEVGGNRVQDAVVVEVGQR